MRTTALLITLPLAMLLAFALPARAQHADTGAMHHLMHGDDSSFAALQRRGEVAMGVDQYTSTHVFDDLPDGGRISLVRDASDTAGVRRIRAHLHEVAQSFARGDFSTPGFVHMQHVPGTDVMRARRSAIAYSVRNRPGGGEIRIRTTDATAVRAVHEFLAFQRRDHRAGGHREP